MFFISWFLICVSEIHDRILSDVLCKITRSRNTRFFVINYALLKCMQKLLWYVWYAKPPQDTKDKLNVLVPRLIT